LKERKKKNRKTRKMPTTPSELLVPRDAHSSSSASLNSKADSADSETPLDLSEKSDDSTPQSFTMREQLTGFPYQQVLVLMAVRFAEPVTFTSLFPYVFFMVKHLRPEDTEASVARYAGYISGSFALCQAFTGVVWGNISDRYGRKPTLIIGLLGSAFSMLWFGLAGNFWWALVARSVGGLLNGNVGVLRTCLGEIAVERRHQALAFSTMPLLWQVGCVVGPMLGGNLASPVTSHPEWFAGHENSYLYRLLSNKPFLLPNIFVCIMLLMSATAAVLFLEEPHEGLKHVRNKNDPGLKVGNWILRTLGLRKTSVDKAASGSDDDQESQDEDETTSLLGRPGTVVANSDASVSKVPEYTISEQQESSTEEPVPDKGKMLNKQVLLTIATYALISMIVTVVDELMPVLLSTSEKPGQSHFPFKLAGGAGMSSAEVGSLISSTGTLGIVLMLTLFPYVDGRFGTLRPFQFVNLASIFLYLVHPYIVLLVQGPDASEGLISVELAKHLKYYAALLLFFSKTTIGALAFPEVMLLIQRAATHKSYLGTINGLSQMAGAAARAVGPICWGLLMAVGQDNDMGWLPWWTLSGFCALSYIISLKIKESNNC
jgi:MFS family permease